MNVEIEDIQNIEDANAITAENVEALKKEIKDLTEKLEHASSCARCGRKLGTAPLTVSDDTMEEYFRCLLGQRPFEKTFKLFDGQLLLTFRELSGEALIKASEYKGNISDDADFADTLETYFITGMLVSVDTYDPKTMITTNIYSMTDEGLIENIKNPRQAYDNLLKAVGQLKIAIIRRACSMFEYLLTALVEKSQDTNFYEGAGLL
jgi:hypothetical protein